MRTWARFLAVVVVVGCIIPTAGAASARGSGARDLNATGPYLGIVVTDPRHEVLGAAGASCGLHDAAAMATIDPDVGAMVWQPSSAAGAAGSLSALRGGSGGVEGARSVSAVVWLNGSARAGALPGSGAGAGSGHRYAYISHGIPEYLSGGAVDEAMTAHGTVAGRLLDALQAAWPNDACGSRPAGAFLIQTAPGQVPVVPASGLRAARERTVRVIHDLGGKLAADELADRLIAAASLEHPSGPRAPTIYLSLMQPPGGFDMVPLLRQAYEQSTTPVAPTTPTPTAMGSTGAGAGGGTGTTTAIGVGVLLIGLVLAGVAIARRLRQMKTED